MVYKGQSTTLTDILVDTGSGDTVFAADLLIDIGVLPEPHDALRRIAGVGGAEYVFEKTLDRVVVGQLVVHDVRVEVGALDYGFAIHGILGIDFLIAAGAKINLEDMTLLPA